MKLFNKTGLYLACKIILYSPILIKKWNLEKYQKKIYFAHEHSIDFDKFRIKKELGERSEIIGYVGRLSEERV